MSLDDQLRQEFAYKNGVLCYDSELDSVVESVYGKNHLISVPIKSIFKESKDYIKYGLCFFICLGKASFWKLFLEVSLVQEGYKKELTRFSQCLNAKTGFVNFWSAYQLSIIFI